jgi:threonine/homoserine/homoserine lactone efflux protein
VSFPDASTLAVFSVAALVLLVIPGPAVLYIVSQSISRGRLAGLVSMLGIQAGGLVHVAAAAAGLSALLVRSALAFSIVKYAGAAYLVYLGLRRLLGREKGAAAGAPRERRLRRLFAQGIVVNVLNPKTALFFLAFLPQFVDPSRGAAWTQILVLGLLFAGLGFLSDGTWALVAGTLGERLRRSARFPQAQRYVSGSIFVGLGAVAAVSGPVEQR